GLRPVARDDHRFRREPRECPVDRLLRDAGRRRLRANRLEELLERLGGRTSLALSGDGPRPDSRQPDQYDSDQPPAHHGVTTSHRTTRRQSRRDTKAGPIAGETPAIGPAFRRIDPTAGLRSADLARRRRLARAAARRLARLRPGAVVGLGASPAAERLAQPATHRLLLRLLGSLFLGGRLSVRIELAAEQLH